MQKLSAEYLKKHLEYVRKNGVSHDPDNGLNNTLNFQDAIGTANSRDIFDVYQTLDQKDRQTFIFTTCASLSVESAEAVLKASFVATMRNTLYEEFDKDVEARETELSRKARALEDSKKAIYNQIKALLA